MIAQDQVKLNLKGLLLAFVMFVAAAVFAIGAIPNGDPLWFLPVFTEKPLRIMVYKQGCSAELFEGEEGFDRVYLAVNQTVTQLEGLNDLHGLSADSPDQYRAKEKLVEVFYGRPITIHVPYRFGHPDSLFIPVTGYFADSRSIFGGQDGQYWAGALRVKTLQPVADAIESIPCEK